MDNQRVLIWAAFGLMLWLTWQTWMTDYGPAPRAPERPAAEQAEDRPPAQPPPAGELPELEASPAGSVQEPAGSAAPAGQQPERPLIDIRTDVFDIVIDTRGGTLRQARIRNYPVEKDDPDRVVTLLSTEAGNLGLLQTGVRALDDAPEANHLSTFTSPRRQYRLTGDELSVPLSWRDESGVRVEKVYRFRRGSYRIDVEQTVINDRDARWRGAPYAQIRRRSAPPERSMFDVDSYSFDGPVIYDGERSSKLDRDDLLSDGPYRMQTANGWVATIQHHFLNAVVPPDGEPWTYRVAVDERIATASGIGPTQTVAAGAEQTFTTTLFVGPKVQRQLEEVHPSLKLTVDYGWLTILSEPLFWLLSRIHAFVGNWGLAIIIVTVLIKLVFYKLTEKSGRSMAKMRKIQPRMKALQERYKDDRQQLSQAMMELYKREQVNPAAGCLPILIQMPFFLAFYWVLLESVEMRQAPFALWITDLSSRDPYFILPLIMGAAMLFQQKLNPAPADPVQARVMQIMPVVFTAFFAFFPAGLVLYWVTNTVLSIAQQWQINRVVEEEDRKSRGGRRRARGAGNDKGGKGGKGDQGGE